VHEIYEYSEFKKKIKILKIWAYSTPNSKFSKLIQNSTPCIKPDLLFSLFRDDDLRNFRSVAHIRPDRGFGESRLFWNNPSIGAHRGS